MSNEDIAQTLVQQFSRMVQADGGSLSLLAVEDGLIRVAYRPGKDADCSDGTCILPQVELQELMAETLQRRGPGLRVVVELAGA